MAVIEKKMMGARVCCGHNCVKAKVEVELSVYNPLAALDFKIAA